ncbi:efflux RND transporter periplasmic adaptor subunit [Neorhizobium sp. P12A]|uniref:efflux RND transporter periplasmic adaptor subunit n=1 Tax=Neorhizobium sp. P12A TaxID=2268027 RepID=UPI0011ED8E09|nr:efflux RND transporter periplasmic adaptor subunit [Neorhizobium sp. P12A]KAA0693367.1 efflux RND transporter periplasmic adaptor subunit [Neorhizobium sp. P12A]
MKKFAVGTLVIVAVVAALGASIHWHWIDVSYLGPRQSTATQPGAVAAVPAEVATATETVATTDINAIGTLQSDESVQLAPEIAGRIASIRFDEGQPVKAGDTLFRLDDTLAKASEEEARVRLNLATSNYQRTSNMARNGTGTGRDLDVALAERNTAAALLNSQQAQLAKLDIMAPFDGVVGLRRVSTGSYVGIGTALVNIEKIDMLKLDFKVPEANLQNVLVGQTVEITVDAIPGRQFTGTIYAIDPMLDVNGRAISIRARLANDDLTLRPGLFARISVKGLHERKVVTVPEAAVIARGQDRFIWTVVDGKARETRVKVGARKVGVVELEGIAGGTTVVTAGHARLRNGAAVDVVKSKIPEQAI